jgi:plastocyanin
VTVIRSLPLLLAATGATLALAACGGGSQPAASASASPRVTASATPTAAAAPDPVATTSVAITNFTFSPAVITVRAGATVTWTNRDEEAHTVAFDGVPASKPLLNGDTYTHTFTQAGSNAYICSLHPFMQGMVMVTAG